MHRDSVGSVQKIVPGDVNWMTAGRGIVHSERTPDAERAAGQSMHGIQTWVALPLADEDTAPSFEHHPRRDAAAVVNIDGVTLRVIAGSAFGPTAPTRTFCRRSMSPRSSPQAARFTLDTEHEERGVYLLQGDLAIDGTPLPESARWPC